MKRHGYNSRFLYSPRSKRWAIKPIITYKMVEREANRGIKKNKFVMYIDIQERLGVTGHRIQIEKHLKSWSENYKIPYYTEKGPHGGRVYYKV